MKVYLIVNWVHIFAMEYLMLLNNEHEQWTFYNKTI